MIRAERKRRLARALAVWALVFAAPSGLAAAEDPGPRIAALHDQLAAWDVAPVRAALPALLEGHEERLDGRLLRARLALMERDFAGAVEALGGDCASPPSDDVASFCAIAAGSLEETRDFKAATSPAGHFVLHYLPGPDEVLVPYAGETLDAAHERFGEILRFRPTEPVHIDILPSVESLARMTPLSREEIEASGTIAMCRYNRMMIVSPRDLVYGYSWRDTLAHEYIHYLLTRRSANRVPLWLHEGLAKYFEKLWQADARPRLDPMLEHLLAEGIRRRKLISLDRLHPSIGKLPSQDDAALAFAQVYSLVEWLVRREGREGLNRMIDSLTAGRSLDEALRGVYELSFRRVRSAWRRWLERRGYRRIPKAYRSRLLFRGSDRKEDELDDIRDERGRDLIYLGDLLRARDRHAAALKEYRRAVRVIGASSPLLQGKMAAALTALERFEEALTAVEPVLHSYPGHVLLHLYQGEALLRLERPAEAIGPLIRAIGLNPFDTRVHALLARAYEATAEPELAAFERRQQSLVGEE